MNIKTSALLCATAIAALTSARADDSTAPADVPAQKSRLERFAEQDYLLGDWDGWRT
jgi:hypothetical protein